MEKALNTLPSTIETIDSAFFDYVEGLNIFCNTINGWEKIPVIWSSAERAFQIKNNRELRDRNGSLIPPIISVERANITKDPKNKGIFQANLSPNHDRFYYSKILNQDKTSNFANADTAKTQGQINFVTSKKNKKQVYKFMSIPIPVYITVEYKINIITSYQTQMNEAVQPFMSRVAQNYFVIKKDNFSYECFMDQNFQQDSVAKLEENERKYKTTITVKVLGFLIGEGDNQEKPQIIEQENAVELKIPKENLSFISEEKQETPFKLNNPTNYGKPVAQTMLFKKIFIIGDGINETYIVEHNFNTRDVIAIVSENFGTYDRVEVAISYSDPNKIELDMGGIIGVDSHRVTILG